MKKYWVYILASKKNGSLYVGITSNLVKRVYEHKEKLIDGFTKKYNTNRLVYAEEFSDVILAIHREKCIKQWKRCWKISLIERINPNWDDLYSSLL